jgi:hypothetical protein
VRYFLSFKASFDSQEERAKHEDKLQIRAMNSTKLKKSSGNTELKMKEIVSSVKHKKGHIKNEEKMLKQDSDPNYLGILKSTQGNYINVKLQVYNTRNKWHDPMIYFLNCMTSGKQLILHNFTWKTTLFYGSETWTISREMRKK